MLWKASCSGAVGFNGENPVFLLTVSTNADAGESAPEATVWRRLDFFEPFFPFLLPTPRHFANESSSETISPPGVMGRSSLGLPTAMRG